MEVRTKTENSSLTSITILAKKSSILPGIVYVPCLADFVICLSYKSLIDLNNNYCKKRFNIARNYMFLVSLTLCNLFEL